jgi:hypothetical protein
MNPGHHPLPRRSAHLLALLAGALTTTVLMTGCSPAPPAGSTAPATPAESTSAASAERPATPPAVAPAAPAQAYVDAVNAGDLDALVEAFAPDGQVTDVNRPIRGRDAIRTWADNEVIGGRLQVLSVTAIPGGQDLLVHWAPQGSAGWRAHYRFTMTATAITVADLQYA